MGFEPTTNGTTIRYSNQLSYAYHKIFRFRGAKIWRKSIIPKYIHRIFIIKYIILSLQIKRDNP